MSSTRPTRYPCSHRFWAVACLVVIALMSLVQEAHLCGTIEHGPHRVVAGSGTEGPDALCPICLSSRVSHGNPVAPSQETQLRVSNQEPVLELHAQGFEPIFDLSIRPPPLG